MITTRLGTETQFRVYASPRVYANSSTSDTVVHVPFEGKGTRLVTSSVALVVILANGWSCVMAAA